MATSIQQQTVTVIYNGLERHIHFEPETLIGTIRERAIADFGITQNPHLLALFPKDGPELNDAQTARQAGVHPGTVLLMRPSTVRGG